MEFDYVIVGGGSAGCVLAGRLSEDPEVSVCLLEAGRPDKSALIHMPAGVIGLLPYKKYNWAFETVPQKGLNGRTGFQPRGKTLGGSSSINAMVYIRGHASDYDDWAALGNEGWGYKDVLPYFKKCENNEAGADEFHGQGGPLNVADLRSPNEAIDVFAQAGDELQLPRTDDFNGAEQEGVGRYQATQKNGQRCSAAKAYLTPHLSRPNLTVMTGARATKVTFEGKRATGVNFVRNGQDQTASARKEVILSGGAFNSPHLLKLSGIGPAQELKECGIEVVHELPGVGENLYDHIDFVISYKAKATTLFGMSLQGTPGSLKALWDYRFQKNGPMTSNFAEAGAFLKTDPSLSRPDIQLHFVPALVDDHGRKLHYGHGFSCHMCLLRPKSVGSVKLRSADPMEDPLIDPNFLGEEEDMDVMVKGTKILGRILKAPAFSVYNGEELYPFDIDNDNEVKENIRARADTVYHPIGTCKMGSDPMAVVDQELKVHGVEGLRVVDASIMPTLIGGNTNAPTIMIGEKAADMIRGVG